jgi:catechol 2,3-dioxygenase-like lactoylglutathione lyase family enzyme
MILACSHLTIATGNVARIAAVFARIFDLRPVFENDMFAEFVLPSKFRVAFFAPVGVTARTFTAAADRAGSAFGVTVRDVQATYDAIVAAALSDIEISGPPKTHPWGEPSFLLTDPDGNRWEITQAPAADGLLINRD